MNRIKKLFLKHKFVYSLLIIALISAYFYWQNQSDNTQEGVRYSTAKAAKTTIIATISGSGQISAENQVVIKPTVAGTISAIKTKEGQEIKAGEVIAQIETKDLEAEVKQAKASVDIAAANLNEKLAGLTKEEILVSQNSVKTAKSAYDNAVKDLASAKKSAESDLAKAKITLDNSQITLDNAQRQYDSARETAGIDNETEDNSLDNLYANAIPTLNSTLVKLRSSLVTADSILGIDRDISTSLDNQLGALNRQTKTNGENSYSLAKNQLSVYDGNISNLAADSSGSRIDSLLEQSLDILQIFKTMDRNIYILLDNTPDSKDVTKTTLDGYKSSISADESTMIASITSIQTITQNIANAKLGRASSDLSSTNSVASAKNSLESAKNSLAAAQKTFDQTQRDLEKSLDSAQRDVESKKIAWENASAQHELKIAPPRAVDLASLRAQVAQARNTYQDKLDNLKSAKILSPLDGIVAAVAANEGDPATTGTEIATVITKQQIGTITLNEVDVAKVKPGQKATITFNAIEDLTITGVVAQVDILGTVSQGVVSYSVKIALDTADERIKSEMSLSAVIITDIKQDVLAVPSEAVKSNDNGSYVEILESGQASPKQQTVATGLSDDLMTEIISGLDEGAEVVTQTINPSASSAGPTGQSSGFNLLGGGGQGMRMR